LGVRHIDGAGDAVDVTANDLTLTHQLNLRAIADADRSEIRLLEIPVDPK
jgi:hypothetical protein